MTYNIHEAKTQFSKLIEKVKSGETVTISKAGEPVAELLPVTGKLSKRIPGRYKGQIIIRNDFDDLSEDFIEGFYK
jgi:prevent-host-death family protein